MNKIISTAFEDEHELDSALKELFDNEVSVVTSKAAYLSIFCSDFSLIYKQNESGILYCEIEVDDEHNLTGTVLKSMELANKIHYYMLGLGKDTITKLIYGKSWYDYDRTH